MNADTCNKGIVSERHSFMLKTYNKLVRDHIPDIIQSAGKNCTTEVLSNEDNLRMIDAKLDGFYESFKISRCNPYGSKHHAPADR